MLNSNKTEMLWLYKHTGPSPVANLHRKKKIEALLTF